MGRKRSSKRRNGFVKKVVTKERHYSIEASDEERDYRGRFRNLVPGDPRNPDYNQSLLIRNSSNEVIISALRGAQADARKKLNLNNPEDKPISSFPYYEDLFTRPESLRSTSPVYVMAGNGFPTQYCKIKKPDADLDDDLRRKVESLQIGDSKAQTENTDPSIEMNERKSYDDWKDELPVHLKSLKFMIDVLNDRHKHPEEFASKTLHEIPPPVFGEEFENVELLQDVWSDPAFPSAGDRIYPPRNKNQVVFTQRPTILRPAVFPNSAGMERRPRIDAVRSCPRRRTRSAEPNISSYRNETPFGTRSYKHRDSDGGFSMSSTTWFNKRRSIELNGGVYVVEEISEEEEDIELERIKRINSADGSPDSFGTDMDLNLNPEIISSPLKPIHRLRRDLWNISPISEDFSESDKEMETPLDESNMSISSTNATFGDNTMSMSVISRMNSSSPILAHSPSLRKTPVFGVNTPPVAVGSGSAARKLRDLARALDDISDKDEDHNTATESEADTDEEKTESFEIDMAIGGDSSKGSEALNNSFIRDKSSSSLHQDSLDNNLLEEFFDVPNKSSKKNSNGNEDTTEDSVWNTLSSNIQAHINVGNTAGFVEAPVDQAPAYPSSLLYTEALLPPIPRFS